LKTMNHERHVALIHLGKKTDSARQIREQLVLAGLQVTEAVIERATDASAVAARMAGDVAILNLGEVDFEASEVIDRISQAYGDQLIVNDALIVDKLTGWERKRWLRHLLHKIDPAFSVLPTGAQAESEEARVSLAGVKALWVLAASIGGPEAIGEFLAGLPAGLPAIFIVAQHLGGDFQPMLRDQLRSSTDMPVEIPWPGMRLEPGTVVLAPGAEKLRMTRQGRVDLQPMEANPVLTPSIDAVCEAALAQFRPVNMAVFSGMSTDGVAGAQQVKAAGGTIIVQTPESTVMDSIIQGVKSRLTPDFEGRPVEMAQYVAQALQQ